MTMDPINLSDEAALPPCCLCIQMLRHIHERPLACNCLYIHIHSHSSLHDGGL